MSKQSLLLVDGDTRSLRVLEVSLRKAGFTVTPAESVADALDKLELHTPDLIISETKFPTDADGFELRRRVRAEQDWAEIPFVFLTAETAIEHKIRGLELGVDDYLTKPIYIKEIVTRINILLQKRQRAHFDERKDGVRFAGRVADMPVVDVIQTIEVSRKSGVIQFVGDRQRSAAIYFRDGKVIDAEAGTLQGEDAVYRLLTWSEGEFEVVFRTVRRREVIATSSQGLLMEGMRRLDEWSRLLDVLPPLTHRFEIDTAELAGRLGEVPDNNNPILRMIDGKRSLLEVIDASDFGDLECLQAISKLYFEGLLIDLDPGQRSKRDTGRPVPLVILESAPTPIEEVASGPIYLEREDDRAPPTESAPAFVPEVAPAPIYVSEDDIEPLDAPPPPGAEDVQGPLMGGYRPSSLRLIDEAVAAAQAIDPSLFESDLVAAPAEPMQLARVQLTARASDPRISNARGVIEKIEVAPRAQASSVPPGIRAAIQRADASGELVLPIEDDDSGVPRAFEGDEDDEDSSGPIDSVEETTEPSRPPFVARVHTGSTGLRMTSSFGHDRAETSGELVSPEERISDEEGEPARELITIMPRRSTREIPLPAVIAPTAEPTAAADGEADARAPTSESDGDGFDDDGYEEPRRPSMGPARRMSMAGGVVRPGGPGPIVIGLLVLASLLTGMTIYFYVHKHFAKSKVVALQEDAGVVQIEVVDATERVMASSDAAVIVAPPPDARPDVRPVRADAALPMLADAGVATTVDPQLDRNKEAAVLKEQANAALDEGDADKALDLANQSIKLRRTAQAFLTRARAESRLNQLDAALASFDQAIELAPTYAATWQAKGMLLWSARRHDEARKALEEYLRLSPNAKDAATVRQMLDGTASP